jgi:hypothetical protein
MPRASRRDTADPQTLLALDGHERLLGFATVAPPAELAAHGELRALYVRAAHALTRWVARLAMAALKSARAWRAGRDRVKWRRAPGRRQALAY